MTQPHRPATVPRVLLFGGSGQVGTALRRALDGVAIVEAPRHATADFERPESLRAAVRAASPAAIVNAAAVTNVDRAQAEPERAHLVNEVAPGVLAEEARRIGAVLLHYSTDYVFDGSRRTPYEEDAAPNPINIYGSTKLGGEQRIAAAGAPHLILRTSWVFSAGGTGFVATMLRLIREREEVRAVHDQIGSPTWSEWLADGTATILLHLARGDRFVLPEEDWGIYHLAGTGAASRVDIVREIIARDPRRDEHRVRAVVPVSAAEFGAIAPRPAYSALANRRAAERFRVRLPDWREGIARMLTS